MTRSKQCRKCQKGHDKCDQDKKQLKLKTNNLQVSYFIMLILCHYQLFVLFTLIFSPRLFRKILNKII